MFNWWLALYCLIVVPAWGASLSYDMSGAPSYVQLISADIDAGSWEYVRREGRIFLGDGFHTSQIHYFAKRYPTGPTEEIHFDYHSRSTAPYCPSSWTASGADPQGAELVSAFTDWVVGTVASTRPRIYMTADADRFTFIGVRQLQDGVKSFHCVVPAHGMTPAYYFVGRLGRNVDGEVAVPPPFSPSICTFSAPEVRITFTSTSLAVSGITGTSDLVVSCSAGTPMSYRISLVSGHIPDGSLSFGNGVVARISINGKRLEPASGGILFPALTSGTQKITAVLTGVASEAGLSRASAVLLLEVQ